MNKGRICVSICPRTADEMVEKIDSAERYADIVEVRFDSLDPSEIDRAEQTVINGPEKWRELLLVTFRPAEQGGFRDDISLEDRRGFGPGLDIHCWGRDFELDIEEEAWAWLWNKRVFSYHSYSGVPENLLSIYKQLQQTYCDIMKIAVCVADAADAIPVFKLIDPVRADDHKIGSRLDAVKLRDKVWDQRMEIVPIAMGEAGKWTRILGLAHGAYMTYAALDKGEETATGQLTVDELLNVYRVKELDRSTQGYGVIGNTVATSLSPVIHNAAFAAAGINAVFIPLQVKDLEAFMRRMVRATTREVELNFAGFAVTMPHKLAVIEHLDEIDEAAKRVGAVNTIWIEGERLKGTNTDVDGFMTPLLAYISDLHGARVAVFGCGGAARACVAGLTDAGADVTVFAKDESKATAFADEFQVNSMPWKSLNILGSEYDIVVNATPLGMNDGDASPVNADQLSGAKLLFDLVTSPGDTALVSEARLAGITTIGGLEMLLAQGARQFEIWTGRDAPVSLMREAAINYIHDR